MGKRQLREEFRRHWRLISFGAMISALMAWLLLYKLGSLTGGLSRGEVAASHAAVGLHGIYHQPFYLPLKFIRSIVFVAFPDHGNTLTRLPNALLGGLTVFSYAGLVWLWHGRRTALLATALFATSAWVLHVSRLASFDVVYLWSLPTLLLSHVLLRKYYDNAFACFASLITWGLLLYVPGLVWFVLIDILIQRKFIVQAWRQAGKWWLRTPYLIASLVWLPLLILHLTDMNNLLRWLGWPAHIAPVDAVLRHLSAVPVHLLIEGPRNPVLWLGRSPIFDIFTLVVCLLGVYFYLRHWRAGRSKQLGLFLVVGVILVGLGGPVSLSLLVPLFYMAAATGLAYLLHEWLKVFPNNPLARGVGIGLITAAVALSCLYNYRAYFVAWPHVAATKAAFHYHRRP